MRKTAIALAVGGALLIPLGASADHKPGHGNAPNPPANAITINAAPTLVLWGSGVAITGKLTGPGNSRETVELEEDGFPYDRFVGVKPTAVTDTSGNYKFTVKPDLNTKYRVIARTRPPVTSPEALVKVRMRVGRPSVSDSTPKRGSKVTFTGFVAPAHDGRIVYIQKRGSDGRFRTVAKTTLVDAGAADPTRSRWSHTRRIFSDSVYRAVVTSHADHVGNRSPQRRLDAHR